MTPDTEAAAARLAEAVETWDADDEAEALYEAGLLDGIASHIARGKRARVGSSYAYRTTIEDAQCAVIGSAADHLRAALVEIARLRAEHLAHPAPAAVVGEVTARQRLNAELDFISATGITGLMASVPADALTEELTRLDRYERELRRIQEFCTKHVKPMDGPHQVRLPDGTVDTGPVSALLVETLDVIALACSSALAAAPPVPPAVVPGWRPIETAPKEPVAPGWRCGPTIYLLMSWAELHRGTPSEWSVGQWLINPDHEDGGWFEFLGEDGPEDDQPTAWMPLASPPASAPKPGEAK